VGRNAENCNYKIDPWANSTTAIYNASVVKIYNTTSSLVQFKDKNKFFYFYALHSLFQRWPCSCKFRSRRIGSRFHWFAGNLISFQAHFRTYQYDSFAREALLSSRHGIKLQKEVSFTILQLPTHIHTFITIAQYCWTLMLCLKTMFDSSGTVIPV
jgi:hypothetical protein